MSTKISEEPRKLPAALANPYGAYEQGFNAEMLQRQVFGAFFALCDYRKQTSKITAAEIARRVGSTRSNVSKMLDGPQNWTLKTISELSTALDVDFRFVLVDRIDAARSFDAGGMAISIESIQNREIEGNFYNMETINSVKKTNKIRDRRRTNIWTNLQRITSAQDARAFDIELQAEEI